MPQLDIYLNLDTLVGLSVDSVFPAALCQAHAALERDTRLREDGFVGIQLSTRLDSLAPHSLGLPHCGLNRINKPEEADPIARFHRERGDSCITVHAGWGMEDDCEVDRLLGAILDASQRHQLPLFVETHRATCTQDMWRTVQMTKRFPDLRFNLDFSHYYCGQELVYGDWAAKLDFLQPILDRTRFIHARIASPGHMQVPIDANWLQRPRAAVGGVDYLAHFREVWTRTFRAFRQHAQNHETLIFAPELLPSTIYYARAFPDASGCYREECDRYQQALWYRDLALHCWRS